jgi:hypothetical protein
MFYIFYNVTQRNIKKEIFRVDIDGYVKTALSQSAFRIYKCCIIKTACSWPESELMNDIRGRQLKTNHVVESGIMHSRFFLNIRLSIFLVRDNRYKRLYNLHWMSPPDGNSFVLFCSVLFCFVLFCLFVLFCFVLFCFVLFCFVLFCFVLFCSESFVGTKYNLVSGLVRQN